MSVDPSQKVGCVSTVVELVEPSVQSSTSARLLASRKGRGKGNSRAIWGCWTQDVEPRSPTQSDELDGAVLGSGNDYPCPVGKSKHHQSPVIFVK